MGTPGELLPAKAKIMAGDSAESACFASPANPKLIRVRKGHNSVVKMARGARTRNARATPRR